MLGSQISTHLTGRAHAGLNAVDVSNYEKLKDINITSPKELSVQISFGQEED